jgi:hypothetical protein
MEIRHFELPAPQSEHKIEAVCIACGEDLIVVIGGGSRYHLGSLGLTISMPSIKDPQVLTNSTYQLTVPGHKEEALAREASFQLSKKLRRNVVVTVGVHEDNLSKEGIKAYSECFSS